MHTPLRKQGNHHFRSITNIRTIMKTVTFLLFMILYPVIGFAQDWAPTGAKWHYSRYFAFVDMEEFTVLESMGDTIINGITATHITVSPPGSCTNVDSDVFMYQTAEKELFAKINDEADFHMLHNYAAQPGDSWEFPLKKGTGGFNKDTLVYTVTEVDTIDINGHPRKILTCMLDYKLGRFGGFTGITELIEGIGDVYSMFPFESASCDDDYILGLRCYEDSIVGFYHHNPEYEDCEFIHPSLSTDEDNPDDDIRLFPNPSTGKIYFPNPEGEYLRLEVVTLQGKVLKNAEGIISEMMLDHIPPGLYILRLVNSKGEMFVKQFARI